MKILESRPPRCCPIVLALVLGTASLGLSGLLFVTSRPADAHSGSAANANAGDKVNINVKRAGLGPPEPITPSPLRRD